MQPFATLHLRTYAHKVHTHTQTHSASIRTLSNAVFTQYDQKTTFNCVQTFRLRRLGSSSLETALARVKPGPQLGPGRDGKLMRRLGSSAARRPGLMQTRALRGTNNKLMFSARTYAPCALTNMERRKSSFDWHKPHHHHPAQLCATVFAAAKCTCIYGRATNRQDRRAT